MVDEVRLSSLRGGHYALRASCARRDACHASWDIDIDQTLRTIGDVTLTELRGMLHCPSCNALIMTTLTSMK